MFLRFNLGVGAGGAAYKERDFDGVGESDVRTRGVVGSFQLALGGSVVDNLILHGNLAIAGMSANRRVDDIEDRTFDEIATNMWLLGGGITYYFMPANLYLTLVVGAAALTERREQDIIVDGSPGRTVWGNRELDLESKLGFGSSLSVGKEWWVGRRGEWGIGGAITGTFYAAELEIDDVSSTFIGHSVSLSFSATLN